MTMLEIIGAVAGVVLAMAFGGGWIAYRAGRKQGATDASKSSAEHDAKATRAAGAVLGEHRSVDDATDRLQRNDF